MTQHDLLRNTSAAAMSEQLLALRGDMTQEAMAEKCDMSLRNYSNLERCISCTTSETLLKLYFVGFDLNHWAENTLKRYTQQCAKFEIEL